MEVTLPNEITCQIFSYIPYPHSVNLLLVCREWNDLVYVVTRVKCEEDFIEVCKSGNVLALKTFHPKYSPSGTILDRCLQKAAKRGRRQTIDRLIELGATDWDRGLWGACERGDLKMMEYFYNLLKKEKHIPKSKYAYYIFKNGDVRTLAHRNKYWRPREIGGMLEEHLWSLYGAAVKGDPDLLDHTPRGVFGILVFHKVFTRLHPEKTYDSRYLDIANQIHDEFYLSHVTK